MCIRDRPRAQFDVPREDYTRIVRGLFAQRRKTLQNNMKNSLQMKNEEIQLALGEAKIPVNSRAENLSPEEFAKLAEIICKNK